MDGTRAVGVEYVGRDGAKATVECSDGGEVSAGGRGRGTKEGILRFGGAPDLESRICVVWCGGGGGLYTGAAVRRRDPEPAAADAERHRAGRPPADARHHARRRPPRRRTKPAGPPRRRSVTKDHIRATHHDHICMRQAPSHLTMHQAGF
jgi:hypothetical protein